MFLVKRAVILPMMVAAIAACQPAIAGVPAPPALSDSQEPGSVLVFPFFQNQPGVSTFNVSVTCPNPTAKGCILHQTVNLRGEWVCPPTNVFSTICPERDFPLSTTVNGTLTFSPTSGGTIPSPPCFQGYLLVWVVDGTTSRNAIKFDGLVGKAVIHQFFQADAAYNAIPIQGGDGFRTGQVISPDTGTGTPLLFDGIHYKTVTGQVTGNVAFPTQFPFVGQGPFNTFLIFLTLDVLSNRSNFTTFVDFNFYNEVENPISTSTNFICWGMIDLRQVGAAIDTGFPPVRYGLNGLVQSDQATKLGQPVSLLGLTFTEEIVNNVFNHNIVPLFNNSVGIPTAFIPEGP